MIKDNLRRRGPDEPRRTSADWVSLFVTVCVVVFISAGTLYLLFRIATFISTTTGLEWESWPHVFWIAAIITLLWIPIWILGKTVGTTIERLLDRYLDRKNLRKWQSIRKDLDGKLHNLLTALDEVREEVDYKLDHARESQERAKKQLQRARQLRAEAIADIEEAKRLRRRLGQESRPSLDSGTSSDKESLDSS